MTAVLFPGCAVGHFAAGDACAEISEAALEYARDLRPDVLVLMATQTSAMDPDGEHMIEGFDEVVEEFTSLGTTMIGVRDNPRFDSSPNSCMEDGGNVDSCGVFRARVLAEENPSSELNGTPGYVGLDLSDVICPDGFCAPVVGNVRVYIDDNHLTERFAESMWPFVDDRLPSLT